LVGAADKASDRCPLAIRSGADTDRELRRLLIDPENFGGEALAQTLAQSQQSTLAATRQDHGKLFAAIAESMIDLTQFLAQDLPQPRQHPVAFGPAMGFVEAPELVDIDQQQTQLVAVAARPLDLHL